MEKYISLDAIVAEIEKRLKEYRTFPDYQTDSNYMELCEILSFINTLEVKKIDLDYIEKELDEAVRIYKPTGNFGWGTLYNVATHFFELGRSVQLK